MMQQKPDALSGKCFYSKHVVYLSQYMQSLYKSQEKLVKINIVFSHLLVFFSFVTLEHKTSHTGQFFLIEI